MANITRTPPPKDLQQALEQAPQLPSLVNRLQAEWQSAPNHAEQFNRYEFSKFFGEPAYRYKDSERNLRLWNVNQNILHEFAKYTPEDEQSGRKLLVWDELRNENTKNNIKKLTSKDMTAEEYLMHSYVGGLHLALDLKNNFAGIKESDLPKVLTHIRAKLQTEIAKVRSTQGEGYAQESFDLVTNHIDQNTHYWELMANLCCKEASDTSLTREMLIPIFQEVGILSGEKK